MTITSSSATTSTKAIFSPLKVGDNNLNHRVVLAPLTRYVNCLKNYQTYSHYLQNHFYLDLELALSMYQLISKWNTTSKELLRADL